jgi:hypothetical protein
MPRNGEMIRDFGLHCRYEQCKTITDLAAAHEWLQDAHDKLARVAQEQLTKLSDLNLGEWGTEVKRKAVKCPPSDNPLLNADGSEHNLSEVMNMCATVERLLDALDWAKTDFAGYQIELCHPTTGANPQALRFDTFDNDLMLRDEAGNRARFEVTDSAKGRGAAVKEKKDLTSLGVLERTPKGPEQIPAKWPGGRMFLVVSSEAVEKLRNGRNVLWMCGTPSHCHYKEVRVKGHPKTVILEVLEGPLPIELASESHLRTCIQPS